MSVTVDVDDLLATLLPDTLLYNDTNDTNTTTNSTNRRRQGRGRGDARIGLQVQIPIYVLIFLLSVVGNVLVLVTLAQNKKMRTVTNVFLLNLAVSDLLLAVFCMPFTLVPILLQNFIFGAAMCVMIRYLQVCPATEWHKFQRSPLSSLSLTFSELVNLFDTTHPRTYPLNQSPVVPNTRTVDIGPAQ
ncbi:hypothetical protein BaRGS_00036494, partial [Batillaria attramentaria]